MPGLVVQHQSESRREGMGRPLKVGFWFDAPVEYSGGLHYLKNLLYALSRANDGSVEPVIFFAANVPARVTAEFEHLAVVVRTRVLQRGTLPWLIHRILERCVRSAVLATRVLEAHAIDVLSHVGFVYGGRRRFRIIAWIPDFQYLHYPELFPMLDPLEESKRNQEIIAQSDVVVLSSEAAFDDFRRVSRPEYMDRGTVLHFVSQPRLASAPLPLREDVERKYGFQGRFFFLPNQFWAHKNHFVVLRAVKLLKDRGVKVLVLCTGNMRDLRDNSTTYADGLAAFIAEHGLQDEVRILGLIDYADVLFMMQNAVGVLNPSRFEGWSSTVEEAKSMGQRVIVSRIPVHMEQAPEGGSYFDPDDPEELAGLMAVAWSTDDDSAREAARLRAREQLEERTLEYGRRYLQLVHAVSGRRES